MFGSDDNTISLCLKKLLEAFPGQIDAYFWARWKRVSDRTKAFALYFKKLVEAYAFHELCRSLYIYFVFLCFLFFLFFVNK